MNRGINQDHGECLEQLNMIDTAGSCILGSTEAEGVVNSGTV